MNLFPMRDGVLLNGKHSLTDYGMVMKDRPIIGPPEPKTATIDVPGSDGLLDMTEAITGEVKFKPRPITLTFKARIADSEQAEFESTLMDDLHGKRIEVILDEDPEWVWAGRAVVAFSDKSDWQETITISLTADPYKLAKEETVIELARPSQERATTQIGVDSSQQDWNTIFVFGEGDAPLFDATQYETLAFRWAPEKQIGIATYGTIQFEDNAGGVLRFSNIPRSVGSFGLRAYQLEPGDTCDLTKVRRIVMSQLGGATMEGVAKVQYLFSFNTIYNDRMPVSPLWLFDTVEDVNTLVNGKYVTIKAGEWYRDAEVRFQPGENKISVIVPMTVNPPTLLVRFRRGRL